MTAHVVYEAWDSGTAPACRLCVIGEQIRQHISFEGLLISDDLDMKALAGDIPQSGGGRVNGGLRHCAQLLGRLDDMQGIAEQVPAADHRGGAAIRGRRPAMRHRHRFCGAGGTD